MKRLCGIRSRRQLDVNTEALSAGPGSTVSREQIDHPACGREHLGALIEAEAASGTTGCIRAAPSSLERVGAIDVAQALPAV
jgi:hypothetical protein